MIYDGNCGFCLRWIERWRHFTADRVEYEPSQSAAAHFPDIPRENLANAVHLIEPDGSVSSGAEAVFRALAHAGRRWPLGLYQRLPLFARISDALYRVIARNRDVAGWFTTLLWGQHVTPPGETRTVSLFLRAMGVVFAVAFLSLWVQVIGLIGENGVLPLQEYLEAARSQLGPERYWLLPGVFWLNASDAALHLVCALGLACSLLIVAGFLPAVALLGAWIAYLSLLGAGQDFLRFQWDSLLLEAGFVAILLAPWRLRLRDVPPPSRAALWLARWLLFRLMITSAIVKLSSADPTWRSFTALDYHYFTQPLPPWTAWYAHHWAAWFQKLSVLVMFAVEGLVPFLILCPRRVRFFAAGAIAALQLLIVITGNYGFFNLLTLALCIVLLDDGIWTRSDDGDAMACETDTLTPRRMRAPARATRDIARRILVTSVFLLTLVPLCSAFRLDANRLGPISTTYRALASFHLVNPYGLFAIMTTDRPEIVIEGSRDGVEWQAYEFRYKPGDLARAPAFTTPHMPRLDWQMWFAALGDVRQNRWFLILCWRLLEGSADVRNLLEHDPFGDEPPRYIRANVYIYEFASPQERDARNAWWKRTLRGPYVRDLMLQNGQLAPAPVSSSR